MREFATLGEQTPLLTILDFPEQKVYISEETNITTELVSKFVQDYLDGKLSIKEKHLVEGHLTDCEMCSDELRDCR